MRERTHYDVLELKRDATLTDVKKAYRRLAVRHHPDRNMGDPGGATSRFREINEAYEVLSDDASRGEYDASIDRRRGYGGGGGGGGGGGREQRRWGGGDDDMEHGQKFIPESENQRQDVDQIRQWPLERDIPELRWWSLLRHRHPAEHEHDRAERS